jgi:glycosyltransferase involved in cell wall biosynthesis
MKIAMVSEHASPLAMIGGVDAGGQNVHVASLSEALARRGHDVVIYTRRDDPHLPERVAMSDGVTVQHVDAGPAMTINKDDLLRYMPAFAEQLHGYWAVDPPAVIHAHFWMSGYASQLASVDLDIPSVQTFHALGQVKRRYQGLADTSPPERIAIEKQVARDATRVIATCTDEVRELVAMGTARSKIDVVPCGVDTRLFSPDGPALSRSPEPRLLMLGRLVARKGIADAIEALAMVPAATLIIAGGAAASKLMNDPEAARLRRLADRLGVADRVEFIGQVRREQLAPLIRSVDLVLCTPWYEPFGIVPLEAMGCGVPVIGSAVGGLMDTVLDGVTGSLIPPRSPQSIAAAVTDLMALPPHVRTGMGRYGVERVRHCYDWDRVARDTERSFRRAQFGTVSPGQSKEAVG